MRRFDPALPWNRLGIVTALALLSASLAFSADSVSFRRGDSNADLRLDLTDPVYTLRTLFLGGPESSCADAADANDDGALNISDPLFTLLHLFLGGPEPPAPGLVCGMDPSADSLGCAAFAPCEIQEGPSEFSSPLAGGPGMLGGGREDNVGGPGPAPPAAGPGPAPAAPARLIEESDIYKVSGTNLFVLNRYRGLQVIDIADLDHPRIVGRAPIFGYPKEMYVRETNAYIIVSDYYSFWRDPVDGISPDGFHGSQLRIVDISDVENPVVVGGIDLAGDCSDSRIVGDVMYLVSHRYPWYAMFGSTDTEDMTQILSVSIGDPSNVHLVDTEDFPRNGWEHHITATPDAIYIAASGWDAASREGYNTRIRYVDISDPAGAIRVRGEGTVEGRVQDRWAMDEFEGVLRVASGQGWGNGDVHLTTLSVADPDSIRQLGRHTLHVDETLTSARFDGSRGYLVSYRNIDPLFTFDLSDPAEPKLLGELEMSGWLDFIVPMGDRIVALGHEDLVDPITQNRTIRLAVSLIDVSEDTPPTLLSRVTLEGLWGWVPGSRDDFAKVFRTLPEQGLIVFPFQAWSPEEYRQIGGVQLIDFDESTLTRRGLIEDAGWVERGIPHGEDTVLTLSSQVFQVMDISNRDEPRLRGRLELARNVQQFALLPGDHAVQLAGDWYLGDTELVVTPIDDPDTAEPLARLRVPSPYGRVFMNGDLAYISSVVDVPDGAGGVARRATKVEVADLSDPGNPRLRGSVLLPEEVWAGYGAWYWGWGDEAVQVNGSTLAFHRYPFYGWWDCLACGVADGVARPEGEGARREHKVYLVDLSDADNPVLASTVTLDDADWAWGLKASGSTLYLTFYRAFVEGDQWMARYYLRRIGVSDPASPELLPEVNIPGMFIDAAPGTPYIYTLETWWDLTAQKSHTVFNVLALDGDRAVLQGKAELEGYLNSIRVKGPAAFATTNTYETRTVEGGVQWLTRTELVAIDIADPVAVHVAGKAVVPLDYAYLQAVEGGRAFVGSGPGIFTYDVGDIAAPAFEKFFRTQGWTQEVVVRGDTAFVPSGYHGVQILDLAP